MNIAVVGFMVLALGLGCSTGERVPSASEAPPPSPAPTVSAGTTSSSGFPEVGDGGELFYPEERLFALSEHGGQLYYSSYATERIHRIDKDGTNRVEIGPWDRALVSDLLRFAGTSVFWLYWDREVGESAILEYDIETLERKRRYALGRFHWDYTMDERYFYAAAVGCENPVRVSRETGELETLSYPPISIGSSTGLLVDEQHLYCSNEYTLIRMNKALDAPPEILHETGGREIGGLAQTEVQVVFAQSGLPVNSPAGLGWLNKSTKQVNPLASVPVAVRNDALRRDARTGCLYFVRGVGSYWGAVLEHCPGEAEATILTSGRERQTSGGIDIDEQYVYWTTQEGIRRLPKPARPALDAGQ